MGYNRELPPKHPSCGNPGVTPLPVPYFPHFGSREPCHTCMQNWMEIQTSLRNHEEDNKDTPSRQPRPPPEDRPISTYPASQKKTAISRQRPRREQQQQQNKKTRKGEQQHINAGPSHRYGMIRTCLLYTSPSPRDLSTSRMPSSA